MKNVSFIPLLFVPAALAAQSKPVKPHRIKYFLDSVYVGHNPLEYDRYARGVLSPAEVAYVKTVKAEGSFFRNVEDMYYDSIKYVFTKNYVARSEEDKKIPSTMQFDFHRKHDYDYYLNNRPYTGKIIDYHFNGVKKEEGYIEKGRHTGIWKHYDEDGRLFYTVTYPNKENDAERIFEDAAGRVFEKKVYNNGFLETYTYYPNGALKSSFTARPKTGGVSVEYFSNGKTKDSTIHSKISSKLIVAQGKFSEINKLLLAQKFDEAHRLDPENPRVYYARALREANEFRFDQALAYMDTAIALEPLDPVYVGDRALIRLRKYAYLRDNFKFNEGYKFSWYLKEQPPLPIPAEEKAILLKDLKIALVAGSYFRRTEFAAALEHVKKIP